MGLARFIGGGIGRFIDGGFGKVVGQFLGCMWCVVWVSSKFEGPCFPLLLIISSHSLYLGIEFEEDLKLILGLFYLFQIFNKFEKLICYMCWEGIFWVYGLWKDYLLCVLRRDLLGLWKGVFWDYEWEFVGFVKRVFSRLPIRREKCSDLEIDVAKKMLN